MPSFGIADAPVNGSGWLYSLDGHWFPARVQRLAGQAGFRFYESAEEIAAGMGGSPIRDGNRKSDWVGIDQQQQIRGGSPRGLCGHAHPHPASTARAPAEASGSDMPVWGSGPVQRLLVFLLSALDALPVFPTNSCFRSSWML
jgi:hypothetical protein